MSTLTVPLNGSLIAANSSQSSRDSCSSSRWNTTRTSHGRRGLLPALARPSAARRHRRAIGGPCLSTSLPFFTSNHVVRNTWLPSAQWTLRRLTRTCPSGRHRPAAPPRVQPGGRPTHTRPPATGSRRPSTRRRWRSYASVQSLRWVAGAVASYGALADDALDAGATVGDVVDVLFGVLPIVGTARVVAAAPGLALALGHDMDDVPGAEPSAQ